MLSQMNIKDRNKLLSQNKSKKSNFNFILACGSILEALKSHGLRFDTLEEMQILSKQSKGFETRYENSIFTPFVEIHLGLDTAKIGFTTSISAM